MKAEIDANRKRQAIMRMLGAKRLQKIGDSYAVLLPKIWLDANAVQIGNSYYVKVEADINSIVIQALDVAEVNGLFEANDA